VPSIAQVLDTLLFGAGSRATAETLGLLSDTVQAWRRELSRDAPDGKDPFAPEAQIHLVNVNLRDVPELAQRRTLLQIPTAFSIAPGEVDQLVAAGRKVLWQSGQFQSLLRSLSEK
jgi:NTE family protein